MKWNVVLYFGSERYEIFMFATTDVETLCKVLAYNVIPYDDIVSISMN